MLEELESGHDFLISGSELNDDWKLSEAAQQERLETQKFIEEIKAQNPETMKKRGDRYVRECYDVINQELTSKGLQPLVPGNKMLNIDIRLKNDLTMIERAKQGDPVAQKYLDVQHRNQDSADAAREYADQIFLDGLEEQKAVFVMNRCKSDYDRMAREVADEMDKPHSSRNLKELTDDYIRFVKKSSDIEKKFNDVIQK